MMQKQRLNGRMRGSSGRSVSRFGGTWVQSILAAVPWINAVVIVVLVVAVNQRMSISPGMVFDLPRGTFREGIHAGLTALMIAVDRDVPGEAETLIFFDDDRYSSQDPDQIALLSERVKSRIALSARREILLLADKRVPHGDVVRFVNAMREAGVQRVSVAEKPE